jgi:hypothetical protein
MKLCLERRPPYSVVAYIAVVATVLMALLVDDGPDRMLVTGGLVLILASFGLWQGVWLAWLLLTGVAAGDLVAGLFVGPAWWTVWINVIMLVLLLARSTRGHTRRGRTRFPAEVSDA